MTNKCYDNAFNLFIRLTVDKKPNTITAQIASRHKSVGRFWLGLGVLSLVGLMGLSAWRQGWFTPTDHLFLELDNGAQGLQIGTLVKLKGFKIGEIDDMLLDPNLNVHVSMRVSREKLKLLSADTQVKFTRETPISPKYIEFLPGTKDKGPLLAGATIVLHESDDVEDIMLVVKNGVEKLDSALSKLNPILDDAKKLTGEAADMRKTVHNSVDVVLANLQVVSGQLKDIGQTAHGMASSIDADRVVITGQIKDMVKTLDTTVAKDVPQISDTVIQTLKDVKKISADAAVELPPTLRSTRSVTQDVSEITAGAKKTWPISSLVNPEPASGLLPLDAFEAHK